MANLVPAEGGLDLAQMAQNQQIQNQLQQVLQRLDIMDARLNANSAKFANSRLDPVWGRHLPYVAVVKYVPGHPWANPPAIPNVQFAAEYVLNSPPPDNLLPLNFDELQGLVTGNLAVTRQRLMTIHWFYNDPRLAVPANGNRAACYRVIDALDYFLSGCKRAEQYRTFTGFGSARTYSKESIATEAYPQ
ncbi:hypothetical protein OROGR_013358 [Orobanche gracilis]